MKNINKFDEIVRWPKKRLDKDDVMYFLAQKFEANRKYSENEVNNIIIKHHLFNDVPLLRRELISRKLLNRTDDGSLYWKL